MPSSSSGSASSSSSSLSSSASPNPYPDGQPPNCPPDQCCPPGTYSGSPIQFFNGSVSLRQDDLTTPSGGLFGHARYFANQMSGTYSGPNGYNWICSQLPYAAVDPSGNVAIFFDPNNPYWFTPSGSGYNPRYASMNGLDMSLVDAGGFLTFTQTDGGKKRVTQFTSLSAGIPGMFQSYTDERGATTSVYSSTGSQINELRRGYGSTKTESLQYAYFASGPAAGLLSTVTYNKLISGTWTPIKRAAFAMYGASDPNGSVNDLMSATQQTWDGSSWDDVAVNYYRYYLSGAVGGFQHGLKSHFGPEAYRLMFNAGITLSTATDASIQQYADHIFQYDGNQKVTVEVSSVCPSCPGGGTTMDRFVYTGSGKTNGFNTWSTKTQQFLPDSSQRVVYANYLGMPIADVTIDPTRTNVWVTFYRYDSSGRQIIKANPSAVSGYNETYDDLVNYSGGGSSLLHASSGLIENTVRYTSTGSGAVSGYPQYDQVQQGQSGTAVNVRAYTYGAYLSNTVHPVASIAVYPTAGNGTTYVTSFAYTYTGSVLTQKVTTFPIVSTGQNGSGSADTITEQFDSTYGFPSQTTDERAIVATFTYDPIMAVMTQQVLNYVSGSSGPGINVTTNFTYDDFGRLLKTLGNAHTVVLSGTATSVQPVTSYAYSQSSPNTMTGTWAPDQNSSAKGYYNGSTYVLIDPVTVTTLDKDGRTIDQITSHRTSSGLLSPTETFAQTDWQTWRSTQYSNSHQTTSTRTYFVIPSTGTGSRGTNYGETDYGYDLLERKSREAVWESSSAATITRTVWTTPQRVASVWQGTDDTGATDVNPGGTNSVQFVQSGAQSSGTSSVSVTLVNNVAAGNTLVAYGCVHATTAPGSGAVSDNLGNTWTRLASQSGASASAGGAGVWVANITTAGAITVTLAAGASNCALTLAEYSGVVSSSPLDGSASASNSTGSTTPASGNLTTANAGDVVLGGSNSGSNVAWTPGTGFIQRAAAGSAGTMSAAFEEQLVTATGTYDPSFTIGTSSPWTAIGVALKSTAPSSNNNMVIVSSNVFDGGSAGGDGNLTQQTQYVSATSGDTRVTSWGFDFRDRKINMTGEVNVYAAYTLDNLDRVTLTQNYNTSASGYLISQSGTNFDARGRQYQTLVYAVDPSTGTVSNVLTGNMWYDPSGNLVQKIAPGAGQVFTKSAYNGVNWITATYTGYNTSGTSYSQAQIVTGDIIIEQAQNTFDEVGTAISVAAYMRLNDATATTTGALTSSNARIMYTAVWSDGIDREIAIANYGAASSFTRPSTPPSTSSTVLVDSTTYDEASRVYQTTDPKSVVNQLSYDNASRTTQTIEDYGTGKLNRTTNYTYTLDNLIATMTAVNSTTGNQTTTWTYGTSLTSSGVARNDLLASITYPDSVSGSDVVSYAYNRLGEQRTITDQRGTVRTLYRDKLGRLTNDCVTTNGTGTDVSVKQIMAAFEVRGMASTISSTDSASQGAGTILNQVQLNYNTFAQLSQEYQSHSGAVVTTGPTPTPCVQYAYDSGGSSSNEIRLNQLTYPNSRTIAYSFGTSGGMNDRLNRVDTIQDTTGTTVNLASYAYLGLGTVVRISYPQPSVWLDLWGGTSGVFAGLDLFNRIIDQRWQNNTGGTPADIDRFKYGYDFNSNRQYKADVVATQRLDVFASMDPFPRLWIFDDDIIIVDLVFCFQVSGCRCRPVLVQGNAVVPSLHVLS